MTSVHPRIYIHTRRSRPHTLCHHVRPVSGQELDAICSDHVTPNLSLPICPPAEAKSLGTLLRAWKGGARPDDGQVSNLTSSYKNTTHEKQNQQIPGSFLASDYKSKTRRRVTLLFFFFFLFLNLSQNESLGAEQDGWVDGKLLQCGFVPPFPPPGPGKSGHSS